MAGPGTHTTAARQDCDGSRSVSSGQASYQASTVAIGGYRWRRADKSRYRAFPAKAESQYGLWVMHTATGSPHSHSTPSTGITASAREVFTSASPCHWASNCSMPRLHPRQTPRRTRRPITLSELSTAREPETVCGNAAVLTHGLDNPSGCPHSHRPTTRSLRSLSIIHQPIIPSVRRWLRCTRFIPT